MAMECRCYHGGKAARAHMLSMHSRDAAAIFASAAILAGTVVQLWPLITVLKLHTSERRTMAGSAKEHTDSTGNA